MVTAKKLTLFVGAARRGQSGYKMRQAAGYIGFPLNICWISIPEGRGSVERTGRVLQHVVLECLILRGVG